MVGSVPDHADLGSVPDLLFLVHAGKLHSFPHQDVFTLSPVRRKGFAHLTAGVHGVEQGRRGQMSAKEPSCVPGNPLDVLCSSRPWIIVKNCLVPSMPVNDHGYPP